MRENKRQKNKKEKVLIMSLSRFQQNNHPISTNIFDEAKDLYKKAAYQEALNLFLQLSPQRKAGCLAKMIDCCLQLDQADLALDVLQKQIQFTENKLEKLDAYEKYKHFYSISNAYQKLAKIQKQDEEKYEEQRKYFLTRIPEAYQNEADVLKAWAHLHIRTKNYEEALSIADKLSKFYKNAEVLLYIESVKLVCNSQLKKEIETKECLFNFLKNIKNTKKLEQKITYTNLATKILKQLNLKIDFEIQCDFGPVNHNPRLSFKVGTIYGHLADIYHDPRYFDKAIETYLELINQPKASYWSWMAHLNYAYHLKNVEEDFENSLFYLNKLIHASSGILPTLKQIEDAYAGINMNYAALNKKQEKKASLEEGLRILPTSGVLLSGKAKQLVQTSQEKYQRYEAARQANRTRFKNNHGEDGPPIQPNVALENTLAHSKENHQNENDSAPSKTFLMQKEIFPALSNKPKELPSESTRSNNEKPGIRSFKEVVSNPDKKNRWLVLSNKQVVTPVRNINTNVKKNIVPLSINTKTGSQLKAAKETTHPSSTSVVAKTLDITITPVVKQEASVLEHQHTLVKATKPENNLDTDRFDSSEQIRTNRPS